MNIIMILMILGGLGAIGFVIYTLVKDSISTKNKPQTTNQNNKKISEKSNTSTEKVQFKDTRDLLEFDNIEVCNDNVALIRTGNEYIGVLEVTGISFNLLSYEERLHLEENYANMLNGIDFPFQIFIQSRRLDLDNYVTKYNKNVDKLLANVKKAEDKLYNDENNIQLKDEYERAVRIYNLAAQSVDYFIDRNIKSNLLSRRYYVLFKYAHKKENYENELTYYETLEVALNDIGIKASAFSDSLERSGLSCRLLNGLEIGELLYTSYNKEDSMDLKLRNAIRARFNHLATTSEPVEFRKEKLKIEKLETKKKEVQEEVLTKISKIAEEENMPVNDIVSIIDEVDFNSLELDSKE